MKISQSKTSKILSLLITFSLVISAFPVMVSAGATDNSTLVYTPIDISSVANGKFWIDPSVSTETTAAQYSRTDFSSIDGALKLAAVWPLAFRTGGQREGNGSYGSYYPPQQAIIDADSERAYLTSKRSGVTYTMPRKTESPSQKEAIVLNRYGADANWGGSGVFIKEQTVDINGRYSEFYYLVAHSKPDSGTASIDVTVTYTDSTTEVITGESLHDATYTGQSASDAFVADIDRLASNGTVAYSSSEAAKDSRSRVISLFEYSFELDPAKTVKSIKFTNERNACTPSIVIVAIVGVMDWQEKITEAISNIDEAVADSSNVEKILKAVESVNELKSSGLVLEEHVTNYAEYNELFADGAGVGDRLLSGLYDDTEITWDNTQTLFMQTESIVSAIEQIGSSYEELSEETRAKCESAYAEMAQILVDADRDIAELKARLELFKDCKVEALSKIFEDALIWTEDYKSYADHEYVVFDFTFSCPVSEDSLNEENIKVTMDKKSISSCYVDYVPITDNDEVLGVTVKIINRRNYSSEYEVTLSETLQGAAGNNRVYEEVYSARFGALIEVDSSDITISESEIKGNLVLKNNDSQVQEYVAIIAVYNRDGMLIKNGAVEGSIAAGKTDSPAIDVALTEDTHDVSVYIVNNCTDMVSLLAPVVLK